MKADLRSQHAALHREGARLAQAAPVVPVNAHIDALPGGNQARGLPIARYQEIVAGQQAGHSRRPQNCISGQHHIAAIARLIRTRGQPYIARLDGTHVQPQGAHRTLGVAALCHLNQRHVPKGLHIDGGLRADGRDDQRIISACPGDIRLSIVAYRSACLEIQITADDNRRIARIGKSGVHDLVIDDVCLAGEPDISTAARLDMGQRQTMRAHLADGNRALRRRHQIAREIGAQGLIHPADATSQRAQPGISGGQGRLPGCRSIDDVHQRVQARIPALALAVHHLDTA